MPLGTGHNVPQHSHYRRHYHSRICHGNSRRESSCSSARTGVTVEVLSKRATRSDFTSV